MKISERISLVKSSMTLAISARAKQMKKEGIDVIGFGAGEPDFDTPLHIKQAAKDALDKGFTKYTPAGGMKELKLAICDKFKRDNNLEYGENEIVVSCGAKHSLFNAVCCLCNEGDEVIIPSPFWVSYPEMVKANGAKPVIVKTEEKDGFKLTASKLNKSISRRTKIVILNSPSNPAGVVYTKEELERLAEVILDNNIFCISDEIYEKIVYDNVPFLSIASLGRDIKESTIVVNGVSKTYSMTGWRIGYAAAVSEVIKAMANLQSHSTSNPASISQMAALEALRGPQDCVGEMVREFRKRRDFMIERINSIDGISCIKPEGAFYAFVSIKGLLGRKLAGKVINNSLQFAEALLNSVYVAVVPGSAFGRDDYIRLSYAVSLDDIKKGMDRIENFIGKLE